MLALILMSLLSEQWAAALDGRIDGWIEGWMDGSICSDRQCDVFQLIHPETAVLDSGGFFVFPPCSSPSWTPLSCSPPPPPALPALPPLHL